MTNERFYNRIIYCNRINYPTYTIEEILVCDMSYGIRSIQIHRMYITPNTCLGYK